MTIGSGYTNANLDALDSASTKFTDLRDLQNGNTTTLSNTITNLSENFKGKTAEAVIEILNTCVSQSLKMGAMLETSHGVVINLHKIIGDHLNDLTNSTAAASSSTTSKG